MKKTLLVIAAFVLGSLLAGMIDITPAVKDASVSPDRQPAAARQATQLAQR